MFQYSLYKFETPAQPRAAAGDIPSLRKASSSILPQRCTKRAGRQHEGFMLGNSATSSWQSGDGRWLTRLLPPRCSAIDNPRLWKDMPGIPFLDWKAYIEGCLLIVLIALASTSADFTTFVQVVTFQ